MIPLYEQYRPRDWSEVCGQDKALRRIEHLRKRGLAGRAYWITGSSGSGKTTIARLLAAEVSDEWHTDELDGSKLLTAQVDRIESRCRLMMPGGLTWCVIINEAHRLTSNIVGRLNSTLEDEAVQRNATWIFTSTNDGEKQLFEDEIEEGPFSSRVHALPLARRGLAEEAGAYWLIDAIASFQWYHRVIHEPFQLWAVKLTDGGGCVVSMRRDTGEEPIVEPIVEHTDFPEDFECFACDNGQGHTMMLKGEY